MLTLADFVLDKFGGDSLAETRDNARALPDDRGAPRHRAPPVAAVGGAARGAARRHRRADGRRGRLRRGRLGGRRWTSCSSACRAAARASSASASPHRHGATFVDLDEIDRARGRPSIPEIFAAEGEAGVPDPRAGGGRRRSGPPTRTRRCGGSSRRAAATVVDPRNRWRAVPRPGPRLARRPARGPRPATAALARTSGR